MKHTKQEKHKESKPLEQGREEETLNEAAGIDCRVGLTEGGRDATAGAEHKLTSGRKERK